MSPHGSTSWKIVAARRSLSYYAVFGTMFGFLFATILFVKSRISGAPWSDSIIVSLTVLIAWATLGALALWYVLSVRPKRKDR
jgi:hypothetical protein